MNAGRELDALVAEKVMGWVAPESEIVDIHGNPMYRDREPFDHICRGECYHRNHILAGTADAPFRKRGNQNPPDYSTDIAAAWLVVEHMRNQWDRGDDTYQFFNIVDCGASGWRVEVIFCPDSDAPVCEHYALEHSAPLAICLAALRAVGVEVPA